MPKRRERNSDEYYRGQIRELEKEVRQLKKYIRELEKRSHLFDDLIDEAKFEKPQEKLKTCDECGKGHLRLFEVVGMWFEECSLCNYRKRIKL